MKESTNTVTSVCMLVTDIDTPTGGVQKNSRLLLREFAKRGVETFVVSRNYHSRPSREIVHGIGYFRSPVIGRGLAVNGILYLMYSFFWLVRNRSRYEIVHCQQMYGPTMAAVLASFITQKPVLTRLTSTGETGEVGALSGMPLSRIRRKLIHRVTRWVVLSREMEAELTSLAIPSEKIDIIYNSTEIPAEASFELEDKKRFRSRLDLGYRYIGVYAGRLSEEKNLDVLVDAWKAVTDRFADAHLLLLGVGGAFRNVETQVRDRVERRELSKNVHFLGHVTNVKDYLIASDVFFLVSSEEGMSNALVEAFACGATIVATRIPANMELCEDGVNAFVVDVRDENGLAETVIRALSRPDESRRSGENARRKAESHLGVERMVDRYLDAYDRMKA